MLVQSISLSTVVVCVRLHDGVPIWRRLGAIFPLTLLEKEITSDFNCSQSCLYVLVIIINYYLLHMRYNITHDRHD